VVALADEVFCHADYAVRDAVDIGRERLRNDRDPHAHKVAHDVFEFRQDTVTPGRTVDDN
jgi:hypothetical protein